MRESLADLTPINVWIWDSSWPFCAAWAPHTGAPLTASVSGLRTKGGDPSSSRYQGGLLGDDRSGTSVVNGVEVKEVAWMLLGWSPGQMVRKASNRLFDITSSHIIACMWKHKNNTCAGRRCTMLSCCTAVIQCCETEKPYRIVNLELSRFSGSPTWNTDSKGRFWCLGKLWTRKIQLPMCNGMRHFFPCLHHPTLSRCMRFIFLLNLLLHR